MEFPLHPNDDDGRERTTRHAQRVRDIDVLDAWGVDPCSVTVGRYVDGGAKAFVDLVDDGIIKARHWGDDQDAARHAAAEALLAEDPSLAEAGR